MILLFSLFVVKFKPWTIRGVIFKFTHWGMERISDKSESTIPWKNFKDLKESKNFIFLFAKEKSVENVFVVRKANFDNALSLEEFKRFVEGKLPI